MKKAAIQGTLLGLMLGDSLGLPYEGLSARRVSRFLTGELRQALIWRWGMVSDDTEHAVMTAQAAALYGDDVDRFQRNLAWRMRWWFLRLPAGIGMATGRAIIKLWLGFPANRSGVFSAGNGPAMRAPILGVLYGDVPEKMKACVGASTRLTHSDPKAYIGALAVAQASYLYSLGSELNPDIFRQTMEPLLEDVEADSRREFDELLAMIVAAELKEDGLAYMLEALGQQAGVSGYIYHTVPMVLYIALTTTADMKAALRQLILLGGDTDTTAAILGGIMGAGLEDMNSIAKDLRQVRDWPLSMRRVEAIAGQVALSVEDQHPDSLRPHFGLQFGPAVFVRNMVFLVIVLLHGFRRLLPPY